MRLRELETNFPVHVAMTTILKRDGTAEFEKLTRRLSLLFGKGKAMQLMDRNLVWKDIWTRKGLERNTPLHHVDGNNLLSTEDWDRLVFQVTRLIGLKGKERILECGCGAGAFLESLLKFYPELTVAGVDYSPTLLERARQRFGGEFHVADMTDLGFIQTNSYGHTASFGAVIYLSSETAARRAVEEMLRVTRPGGTVFIGEVSDLAKRDEAESIRRTSHQGTKKVSTTNPDHLYLPKQFFLNVARDHGLNIRIIDHLDLDLGNYQVAQYRYSVYLEKNGEATT
jgi:SAM-dependent methyltransferase